MAVAARVAHPGHCLGDLRPPFAGMLADRFKDPPADVVVGQFRRLVDGEPFSGRPDELERPALVFARPAGLLEAEAALAMPARRDVDQRVADALPRAADLARLR